MATFTFTNGATSITIDDDGDCDTVSNFLDRYGSQFGVPANANVSVNSEPATGSTPVSDGDRITVTKTTGSKG